MPDKSLIWFRKNLRVFDNKCLSKALTESQEVIAIYVIDERLFEMTPYGFTRASEFRLKFLYESLINLKNNLAMMNLELIILEGNSFQ
ncbi:MAG: cryptochrome DASH, partial [Proteobacteria bacterium]|nr:cryptochrome DASH [Pseudomonadota bacterium]